MDHLDLLHAVVPQVPQDFFFLRLDESRLADAHEQGLLHHCETEPHFAHQLIHNFILFSELFPGSRVFLAVEVQLPILEQRFQLERADEHQFLEFVAIRVGVVGQVEQLEERPRDCVVLQELAQIRRTHRPKNSHQNLEIVDRIRQAQHAEENAVSELQLVPAQGLLLLVVRQPLIVLEHVDAVLAQSLEVLSIQVFQLAKVAIEDSQGLVFVQLEEGSVQRLTDALGDGELASQLSQTRFDHFL